MPCQRHREQERDGVTPKVGICSALPSHQYAGSAPSISSIAQAREPREPGSLFLLANLTSTAQKENQHPLKRHRGRRPTAELKPGVPQEAKMKVQDLLPAPDSKSDPPGACI